MRSHMAGAGKIARRLSSVQAVQLAPEINQGPAGRGEKGKGGRKMNVIIHHSDGTKRETHHYNSDYSLQYIYEYHARASFGTDGNNWHVYYFAKEGRE